MILIMCTVPDEKIALIISKGLVENKLAPCVNILNGIRSIYFWNGKIEDGRELLLLIKTKKELFKDVEEFIIKNHPYEVPEIISFKIENSLEEYEKWFMGYLES